MERKYYLRGLGIGIVMTAVIMGIALSGRREMSDEEIIRRAKELGMVEDTYLVDAGDDGEQTQEEQNIEDVDPEELSVAEPAPENTPAEPEPVQEPAEEETLPVAQPVEEEPAETESDTETEPEEPLSEENTNEMTRQEETQSPSVKVQTVTVVSGDSSYTVSRKLKEAGVVMSAETFDTYLCEKGYDKILRAGTFRIPADASDEQIARIITGQE